ncbi:cyclase [Chitinivorax tropicus]|uniref:Cyclase n=1 Tax=Chitinivorax tropicus TaxID=714531 RepID=A0A840MNQ2_9PROT|nr:HisA/HisF-related TIM barrel protein [Chitinivorax tropicus]MBB5016871.1 cyclase [Chitinivorax tropicus]
MLKKRLIAVLILRDGQVVQSVRFKHTNVIHYDAVHAVECFNKWAVDELVMLNVSPDSTSREGFADAVRRIAGQCFVPLSAGGWINDAAYAETLLRAGADKLVLNTAFHTHCDLVQTLSARYGRQCIIGSMDVKLQVSGETTVMVNRGRDDTKIAPIDWARRMVELGAGELFFNSIDHDGARKGYHLSALQAVCQTVDVPVIAFGGVFTWQHLVDGLNAGAQAAAAANIFHYTEHSTRKAKRFLAEAGIPVRSE